MTARPPRRANRFTRGRLKLGEIMLLCLLLVIPGYALTRLTPYIHWSVLVAIPLVMSGLTFVVYRSDKRRAEAGKWRIPETTIHFIALMGGWPGAYLAQRAFRHKTSKISFQCVFWLVVLLHQFVALDSLLDWRLTKNAFHTIQQKGARLYQRSAEARYNLGSTGSLSSASTPNTHS